MINNDDVYIRNNIKSKYNKNKYFNPKDIYPEFKNWNIIAYTDYIIYDEVRKLFIDMGLDNDNIGTEKWNPLKDFIKEGNTVLIKPNLVRHKNPSPFGSLKSIITNVSTLRPIIDYTIKALKGTGKIIIADAPVQGCNFEKLLKKSKLGDLIKMYNSAGNNLLLLDLRKNQNDKIKTVNIDLGENSYFCDNDNKFKKYLVADYSDRIMEKSHYVNHHEYISSDTVLNSDVIINVFKPKCHRIAGITASMKNLIGTISKKECLPHYAEGSISENGDEYQNFSNYRKFLYRLFKNSNILIKPFQLIVKSFNQLIPKASVIRGCWYKNDTIWRTILDVNNVIDYSNSNGTINFKKKKRIVFNLGDMIISGEKNGPLHPRDKYTGCLIAGFNRFSIDKTVCKMMGFNEKYIKYLKKSNIKYKVFCDGKELKIIKNYNFKTANGWEIIKL
jgi:uncharacterized protein (DUF362 family)